MSAVSDIKYSTYDDTPRSTSDDNIEVKPSQTSQSAKPASKVPPGVKQSGSNNVLNSYRSYTYNFTFAGLKKERVNDPESYRNSELELVILKSAGKGSQGISNLGANKAQNQTAQIQSGASTQGVNASKNAQLDSVANKLIQDFNRESPGRFDMFIENVEVETLMAYKNGAGTTLPTSVRFEVFEPYSINGFIEALHTAAVASGYPTYTTASFLLKMEFVGYPDSADLPTPKIIEGTERYFVLRFTGIEVQITERGTRYQCTAVPYNESGFGQPSQLKAPVKMSGTKVKLILQNLMEEITKEEEKSQASARKSTTVPGFDEYRIKFPTRDDDNATNEIGTADVNELGVDSIVYRMPDQGTTPSSTPGPQEIEKEPGTVRYNPSDITVQFQEGKQIYECIETLIRDSTYVRNILKNIGQTGKENSIDEYGMVKYFLIKMEVTNKDTINDLTKNPYRIFTYVVTEYKIHYTKIPLYAQAKIDTSKIKNLSIREYNYIYTGKNTDVLNFKLNFNTLFFEAIPKALGNNDAPAARDAIARNNEGGAKTIPEPSSRAALDQTSSQGAMSSAQAIAVNPIGGSAGSRQDDPYFVMARNMHDAVINSKASMITGEIEIVGDPLYIATGGIGNYNPKKGKEGVTVTGEADYNYREVLITVNFRNPIDITSLHRGGRMYFESKKVPFSGIYRVNQVNSSFKDGQFKQVLSIIRIPGQIVNNDITPSDINSILQAYDEPENKIVEISENAAPSERADEISLLSTLGRGLPDPGLPGELSNFTASPASLGQAVNSLLTQVSGAVTGGIGKLTSAAAVFGGSVPGGTNQLASGIRMQASGLIGLAQSNLSNAALIGQAANTIQGQFPVTNVATALATDIATKATNLTQLTNFPGSGIGAGATVSLNRLSETVSAEIAQGTASAQKLINELGSGVAAKISGLGSKAAGLVNGVSDKITALQSVSKLDPTNLAEKFGINPAQLSGLSAPLQSKVLGQLSDLASKIPANVDLSAATSRGLVLDYVSGNNLANIPATAPYATAPEPVPDQAFLAKLKSPEALARAFGVSDVSKISQNLLPTDSLKSLLSSMPSSVGNPLSSLKDQFDISNITAAGDKMLSAGRQISSITGIKGSVESTLNSVKTSVGSTLNSGGNLAKSATETFGSKSQGTSPLDRIMLTTAQTLPGTGVT
jgi:hypothetical protein